MPSLARLSNAELGEASLECAHNREIETFIGDPKMPFLVLSEDAHQKLGVDYDNGEVLIYSPHFKPEVEGYNLDNAVPWIAQSIDLEFSSL